MTDMVDALRARIAQLEREVDDLTRLYSAEHYDPKRPALGWMEVPNKVTGQLELVCAGLMSVRSFPGLKYFSYLPEFRGSPCPVALPTRTVSAYQQPPVPMAQRPLPSPRPPAPPPPATARALRRPPRTDLAQRRQPGMKLDGTPRRKPGRPRRLPPQP